MTYLASAGAALWGSVQLWTGRANQAWGPNRTWNSGPSFEQQLTDANNAYAVLQGQYQTLQGQYNAAVADRDTWNQRANQAWGQNRIWNNGASFENQAWSGGAYGSGELWSTAYSRVLPPAGDQLAIFNPTNGWGDDNWQDFTWSTGQNPLGHTISGGTITIAKTANYVIGFMMHCDYGVSNGDAQTQLLINGGVVRQMETNGTRNHDAGYWHVAGTLGAGTTVRARGRSYGEGTQGANQIGGGSGGNSGPAIGPHLGIIMIPNQSYPH